jgi:hypothetical protein
MDFSVICTELLGSMPGISVTRAIYGRDHKVSSHIGILTVAQKFIKMPKNI